jgi:hypothetical protein
VLFGVQLRRKYRTYLFVQRPKLFTTQCREILVFHVRLHKFFQISCQWRQEVATRDFVLDGSYGETACHNVIAILPNPCHSSSEAPFNSLQAEPTGALCGLITNSIRDAEAPTSSGVFVLSSVRAFQRA